MKKLRKQKYGHFFTICMKTETAVLIVSGIEEKNSQNIVTLNGLNGCQKLLRAKFIMKQG